MQETVDHKQKPQQILKIAIRRRWHCVRIYATVWITTCGS